MQASLGEEAQWMQTRRAVSSMLTCMPDTGIDHPLCLVSRLSTRSTLSAPLSQLSGLTHLTSQQHTRAAPPAAPHPMSCCRTSPRAAAPRLTSGCREV
jgi:hypothetical protein